MIIFNFCNFGNYCSSSRSSVSIKTVNSGKFSLQLLINRWKTCWWWKMEFFSRFLHIFSIFILLFTLNATSPMSVLNDVGRSAVSKGVIGRIPEVIPKPEDIFQAGKNLIAGYPFEKAFDVINTFCSVALSKKGIITRSVPHIGNMSFVLKTNSKNISVPLNRPERLWSLREFNRNLPLVMMNTGWTTNSNDLFFSTGRLVPRITGLDLARNDTYWIVFQSHMRIIISNKLLTFVCSTQIHVSIKVMLYTRIQAH